MDSGQNDIVLKATPNKSHKWVIIVVIIVVLIVLGVGLFLAFNPFWNNKSSGDSESNKLRVELGKMIEVAEELSVYDTAELVRIYIEEDYDKTRDEIYSKLAGLDQTANEYIAEYVEKVKEYVESTREAIEVYSSNGCFDDVTEETMSCQITEEMAREYTDEMNEAYTLYLDVREVVETVQKLYNNGGEYDYTE